MSNYTITYTNGSLTVNTAPLTITASNESKTYGSTYNLGSTAFTTSGLLNSDSVSSATLTSSGAAATATVAGGPYAIVPSAASGSGLSNYTITYTNGSLTVNTAPLTIMASNESKTYGDAYAFAGTEFTTSGLLNSDSVTGATLTSAGSAATATVAGSTYSIVPSAATGTGLSNYTISYVNGNFTVTKAPLAVTANNEGKVYGSTYTFAGTEFTASGLKNSDSVTSTTLTSAGAASGASVAGGPYAIVPSAASGSGLSNYNVSYVNGQFTVYPAALNLSITANNESKTYGSVYTFNGTEFTTSGLLNSDTVTHVTLSSAGAPATATVGSYAIIPSVATGSGLSNYTITYGNGQLTVNKAPLTITANDENKIFSNAFAFSGNEFTSTGLLNGDTINNVALTSAGLTSTAAVGSYAIIPSAATGGTFNISNYTPTYVNGELTVSSFVASFLPATVVWVSQNLPAPGTVIASQNVPDNTPQSAGQGNATTPLQETMQNSKQDTVPNYSISGKHENESSVSISTLNGLLHISPELVKMFDLGYLQNERQKPSRF